LPGIVGIGAVGVWTIGSVFIDVDGHPFKVTDTVSTTFPDAPAVKVMAIPVSALVAVPFVTLQRYVAPRPASGTDAVLPAELKQTDEADVITEDGVGLTVMTAWPVNPVVTLL
jgi:hypothetical protein